MRCPGRHRAVPTTGSGGPCAGPRPILSSPWHRPTHTHRAGTAWEPETPRTGPEPANLTLLEMAGGQRRERAVAARCSRRAQRDARVGTHPRPSAAARPPRVRWSTRPRRFPRCFHRRRRRPPPRAAAPVGRRRGPRAAAAAAARPPC
eukprot:scaffold17153_cov107-Isochrysis_galbana.AAC.1